MEFKDSESNNDPPDPQDNNLITALVVGQSPSGKIRVLSNDRVIMKRTESGRLSVILPDGPARNELIENAYGLPGSSVVCIGIRYHVLLN